MLKAKISFKTNSKDAELNISQAIINAVGKSVSVMERNIKARTPIIHGHLARSVSSNITGFGTAEVFTSTHAEVQGVTKEINYAIHVEYGTKYMAPRAMFRKGVADSEERINQIFAEETKKVVK